VTGTCPTVGCGQKKKKKKNKKKKKKKNTTAKRDPLALGSPLGGCWKTRWEKGASLPLKKKNKRKNPVQARGCGRVQRGGALGKKKNGERIRMN